MDLRIAAIDDEDTARSTQQWVIPINESGDPAADGKGHHPANGSRVDDAEVDDID